MSTYGFRDILDVELVSLSTGKPVLFLDYLETSSQTFGQEIVKKKGGRGAPVLVTFSSGNSLKMEITSALLNAELLGILFGTTVTTSQQYVKQTEKLTVTGTTATITNGTPYVADLTNYPMTVYKTDDWSTMDDELTAASTPTTGQYNISGTTLTFGDTLSNQKVFVSYYKASSATNKRVKFQSDKYTQAYKLQGHCLLKDTSTQLLYPAKVTIPKLQLTIDGLVLNSAMEGEATSLKFTGEALKSSDSTDLIYYDIDEGATGI